MKKTRLIHRFPEKNLIWGNGPLWVQNWLILIYSGSTGRIFLKFCTMTACFPDYAFNENIHMYCFHEWDVFLIHLFYDHHKN